MARILYVDDEADIREIATMSIELDPGLEVRTCASGPEALAELEQWRPDLILLDLMMPGMDGTEVLRKLREQSETADIPVVFITARRSAQEAERLQALGARSVLAKPFDPMSLAGQVRDLLS